MPIKKQHFETWLDFYELIQWGEADIKINFSFLFTIKSGVASKDDMNCHWVKLRSEIQGIQPPNLRSEVKILNKEVSYNTTLRAKSDNFDLAGFPKLVLRGICQRFHEMLGSWIPGNIFNSIFDWNQAILKLWVCSVISFSHTCSI